MGKKILETIGRFRGSLWFTWFLSAFCAVWIVLNSYILINPFDPYPYDLLVLILSVEASVMMPLIMLASSKEAEKDRQIMAKILDKVIEVLENMKSDFSFETQSRKDLQDIEIKLDKLINLWYNKDIESKSNDQQKPS